MMTMPPMPLPQPRLNDMTDGNSEINGLGPPTDSDTQANDARQVGRVERNTSLLMQETLRRAFLLRCKSDIGPVPAPSQRRQDQQQANRGDKTSEEEDEAKTSSPLLPTSPRTSSPESSAAAPPLSPPVGLECLGQDEEPVYLEILPDETTTSAVNPLARSSSFLNIKPKPPAPAHRRTKSDPKLLLQKPAWFLISLVQQKSKQGAKWQKTFKRPQRPERPPPPDITQKHGAERPPLQKQRSASVPSDSCDPQEGVNKTSRKMSGGPEKKPWIPLQPSLTLPRMSAPKSPAVAPPLSPLVGQNCSMSEQKQVPLYVDILPEESPTTEVRRSTSFVTPKPEPAAAVQRSKSDSGPIYRNPAGLQQKENPLPRPERPPLPNVTQNRGAERPPLQKQMSTSGPSIDCDPQNGDSGTPPVVYDTPYDSRTHQVDCDSQHEDRAETSGAAETKPWAPLHPSLTLPRSSTPKSSATPPPLSPPVGLDCVEQEEDPVYLEILPEESTACEVNPLGRSTSLVTVKPKPPAPVQRSKSDSEHLILKPASFRISCNQQQAKQGLKKPLRAGKRPCRPERPPPPNFTQNRGAERPPLQKQTSTSEPLVDRDPQDGDSGTPPVVYDTPYDSTAPPLHRDSQNEDSLEVRRSTSFVTPKPEPATPVQRSKSHSEPLFQKTLWLRISLDQQKAKQKTKSQKPSHPSDRRPRPARPPPPKFTQNRGTERPPLQKQTSTSVPSVDCDPRDGDGGTPTVVYETPYDSTSPPVDCDSQYEDSFETSEEEDETKNCTPLHLGPSLPGTSSPKSSNTTTLLSSPIGLDCPVSEPGDVPPYVDILPEESTTTEVRRSTSFFTPKPEPVVPVQRSKSHSGPLFQNPAGLQRQKPLRACDRHLHPQRPPPPGFTQSRRAERPPLQKQMSTSGPSDGGVPQGEGRNSPPVASENLYDSKNPPVTRDSQYEGNSQTFEEQLSASLLQTSSPPSSSATPPVPPRVDLEYSVIEEGPISPYLELKTAATPTTEDSTRRAVHDFFSKRPLPPVPQSQSQSQLQSEPLYEELGSCSCANSANPDSVERKPEDIEVLMAWWRTVDHWYNMPLDSELTEEEEKRVFALMAYRIKMGLRLFKCLLSRNGKSLEILIAELNDAADNLDRTRKTAKFATMTGGTTGAVGGVLTVAGLALAPMTLGASLVVTAVGVGVATAGGLTGASAALSNKVTRNQDGKNVEKIALEYWDEIFDIERCLRFLRMAMGWLGQQDSSRLKAADEETAAVARLAAVVSANSSSIPAADQSLEILWQFSEDIDDFFTGGEPQKMKKDAARPFAARIRSLAQQLQDELASLMRIREIFTLAASTTGVFEDYSHHS